MKFMDFDREYTSIVYKSEAGNITLGEYVERGEALLNKVKAKAYQEGFMAGVKDTTVRIDTLKAEAKAEAIDKCIEIVLSADVDIEPSSAIILDELQQLKEQIK